MTQDSADGGQRGNVSEAFPAAVLNPIFMLCMARSGSTLGRFTMDANPHLACPPETNVPALCAQLATVWSLIEGAPLSSNRGDEPPEIPDAAILGAGQTMGKMLGSYLARRGKKRYCDKSLGTARFAYLLQRIWPMAQFICLYRHPMDVIASGMEACPWGLNGYGFDPYIAETPGNAVHALARYWVDSTATILAAEEQYNDKCHRVRYEDLVDDPQAVADSLFEFLGVPTVPDIAKKIFAAERERFGPSDYKIWHTSTINRSSVGRGWTVPAGLIGPQVRAAINELCGKLGYVPVDENWGTADKPADLRLPPGSQESPAETAEGQADAGEVSAAPDRHAAASAALPRVAAGPEFAKAVGDRLEAGLARADEGFASRWAPCSRESFLVVATPADGGGPDARWLVDLAARTVTLITDGHPDDDDPTAWHIIASADTWEQVISGRTNLSVALRHHQMRYLESGESGPFAADTRMGVLGDLLGLASWGQARSVRSSQQAGTASDAEPQA